MDRAQAQKELIEILEASLDGPTFTMEEVEAHIAGLLAPKNNVYLTGDVHGRFDRVVEFCVSREVEKENTFILLGDAGLNYYGDGRDTLNKEWLAELPITFFCIHGNHEMRPSPALGYELREYHGGQVWVQPAYPNIVFAVDGEIYNFCGHSCLVIGGAYSVDKYYRLAHGWGWWDDEQPSDAIKAKVERVLSERDWKVDIVLSHTCPLRYEPVEVFLPGVNQSTVDKSTERWLGELESRLHYERWYCAHYHTEKQIDKIRFLFNDYAMILNALSIEEEQAIHRRRAHEAELIQASGLFDDLETTDDILYFPDIDRPTAHFVCKGETGMLQFK